MLIKEPLVELESTQLYQYVSQNNEVLAAGLKKLVTGTSSIAASIFNHFPFYTRHDSHHSFRVCNRISQIVKPSCFTQGAKGAFSSSEAFLLVAAAYTHDVGMAVFPGEEQAIQSRLDISVVDEPDNPKLQEYLRSKHSDRGGKYVSEHAEELGVPRNLVAALSKLMLSHNLSVGELESSLSGRYAAEEQEIDLKQLAIILCIADALEFSETRVVDGVLSLLGIDNDPAGLQSYRENMKHVSIGDSVAVGSDGTIVVSGSFRDPDVLSLAHNTLDNIERWVRGYYDIERNSSVPRLQVRPNQFARKLEFENGYFERIGIRLNKATIIDLITSNAVWQNQPGVSVRELIQNSVEACRYRRFHSPTSMNYQPSVKVEFDSINRTVVVLDNGCGMSMHTVLEHFLTIGNSRSRDFAYRAQSYEPIARFGIGFWSVFAIASYVEVETTPFEHSIHDPEAADVRSGICFEVSIEELKDYVVFKESDALSGTKIILHLKSEVSYDALVAGARKLLLCNEIPIALVNNGIKEELPLSVPDIDFDAIIGSKLRLKREYKVEEYAWNGKYNGVEIVVKLLYRMQGDHATFLLDANSSMLMIINSHGHYAERFAICGFTVGAPRPRLSFDLFRVGLYYVNALKPSSADFSLDRSRLLEGERTQGLLSSVEYMLYESYRAFLNSTNSYAPSVIRELNKQSRMHGGETHTDYTGDALAHAYAHCPDLLCFKLYVVESGQTLQTASAVYCNTEQLKKTVGLVFLSLSAYIAELGLSTVQRIESENLLPIIYEFAKTRLGSSMSSIYVVESDGPASMLFDNCSSSMFEFITTTHQQPISVQVLNLSDIDYTGQEQGVLTHVRGMWGGTVYVRDFIRPDSKNYVFVGRQRLVVRKTSSLHKHLALLSDTGQVQEVNRLALLLQEDEQGYANDELLSLLH